MKTRKLGRTDIDVSEICLGTMTWGEQNTEQQAFEQLDLATSEGINFIDAAEMYPVPPRAETQGLTESYLGNWLAKRGRRDDLVIASKVAGPGNGLGYLRDGPRLTRDHIRQACEDSLRRLKTDYIDLYFLGRAGYPLENYIKLAKEKDAGVTQATLAYLLSEFKLVKVPDFMIAPIALKDLREYFQSLGRKLAVESFPR